MRQRQGQGQGQGKSSAAAAGSEGVSLEVKLGKNKPTCLLSVCPYCNTFSLIVLEGVWNLLSEALVGNRLGIKRYFSK